MSSTLSLSGGKNENEMGVKEDTSPPAYKHLFDKQRGSEDKEGITVVNRKEYRQFSLTKAKHTGIAEGVERENWLKADWKIG
ncbi:hypothetical protein NPIL_344311 [Nephila pilipes]|uniref:Uncharacterized protein n=1 Tax=Nephila pilipes TaxID=299642 RepID=A0A8X6N4N4_NEPPI|nr:hypothetical protein NPIL_344311 [Nephila pilipes]